MPNVSELLERESATVELERGGFERLLRRRDRKRRNQRIGAWALALAVSLVAAAIFLRAMGSQRVTVDRPTPPPPLKGMVVTFTNNDPEGVGDLVARDPDTGEVRTLVPADALSGRLGPGEIDGGFTNLLIGSAAPSADGRWVAYEIVACGGGFTDEASAGGLWVTNGVDEPRQLTKPCFEDPQVEHYNQAWAWSPTGTQLVVERTSADGDSLMLIVAATGARTELGDTEGRVTALEWSPDGTRIAYATMRGRGSVYVVDTRDGQSTVLLASSIGYVGGLTGAGIRWSPDGAHIVIQSWDAWATTPPALLFVMNADGSDLRRIAGDLEVEDAYGSSGLSWSPDGTRMAYATFSGEGPARRMQVWIGSPDGSRRLLFGSAAAPSARFENAGDPVWSPDGSRIAFGAPSSNGEPAWLVTNADGTGETVEIDELRYLSWRGGWYFCGCYG